MDKKAYVYNEGISQDALLPFALTDYFIEWTQQQQMPLLHFWQLENTFIMGMKDTRVNDLSAGINSLKTTKYTPVVRNAGGLGVINDLGVLNISLFLPNENKQWSIDAAYEQMTSLMKEAFATKEFPIEAFEVSDSYCPGKFDLSIHGKKIAGIAQRRLKDGIAIMLYLSVTGDQNHRGEVVKNFYQAALKEDFGKKGFPPVNPSVMANLADFYPITVTEVREKFQKVFENWLKLPLDTTSLKETLLLSESQNYLKERFTKMMERNADLPK